MTGARGDMAPEFEPLGRKVERKAEPAPAKKRAPDPPPAWGIRIGPDGKWHTDIPPPPEEPKEPPP